MSANTHIGHSQAALFASESAASVNPSERRSRGGSKAKARPTAVESETPNTIYELYDDGTAGGEKLNGSSEEYVTEAAREYLATARRKVEFYSEWLKRQKAGKRRPWRAHV